MDRLLRQVYTTVKRLAFPGEVLVTAQVGAGSTTTAKLFFRGRPPGRPLDDPVTAAGWARYCQGGVPVYLVRSYPRVGAEINSTGLAQLLGDDIIASQLAGELVPGIRTVYREVLAGQSQAFVLRRFNNLDTGLDVVLAMAQAEPIQVLKDLQEQWLNAYPAQVRAVMDAVGITPEVNAFMALHAQSIVALDARIKVEATPGASWDPTTRTIVLVSESAAVAIRKRLRKLEFKTEDGLSYHRPDIGLRVQLSITV